MELQEFGWDESWSLTLATVASSAEEKLRAGRVLRSSGMTADLITGEGEIQAPIAGRLAALPPVVGDWVVLSGSADRVEAILPRRSRLARRAPGRQTVAQVVAANVDVGVVVMGLDDDFNLRRLERFLALVWESGARPLVLLSKADLDTDVEGRQQAAVAASPGVEVAAISALSDEGVAAFASRLRPASTFALLGSSGVGKSTLINRLLGEERLATAAVRARDGRGQHTTTFRQLLRLPGGALVVDSPGVREVQPWGDEGIGAAFADLEAVASGCRFRDCRHQGEPGCAVVEAVRDGRLDSDRVDSYLALGREAAALQLRQAEAWRQRRAKRAVAAIHKEAKRLKKRW